MREFTLDTPSTVCGGSRDTWRIFENPSDLANGTLDREHARGGNWHGGTGEQAKQWARTGKPELVAPSDAILTALEASAESIVTRSSRIINDVAGACPNVPAMLAGQPLAMRRRMREHTDRAPVCVIVDTTISAGIGHGTIRQRGAALLAFVRLLSQKRAVELYSGVGVHNGGRNACYVFTRIDTAPLDLTRAAFMLCDTAATRVLGYGNAPGFTGAWPYRRGALSAEAFSDVARQAFPHLAEFVAVPGLHLTDKLVTAPLQWIIERLAEFGELNEAD